MQSEFKILSIVRFSHFKPVLLQSIKIIFLHRISEIGVWVKRFKKDMLLSGVSQASRVVKTF